MGKKLQGNIDFYDSLAGLVRPVIDNTSKQIVAPVQRYDAASKKITPVFKATPTQLVRTYTSSGGKTPAKYIAPTPQAIQQKATARRLSEQQTANEEFKQRQLFHDNNPVSKLLGTNKALPSTVKPTTPELLQGMARGIEDFYHVPQAGILNDFVNPLHMASNGIIAPWADVPQNTIDINNYYNENPGAPNILFGKNVDKFIPFGAAALSTAMTAPFIKEAPGMIKAGVDLPKTIGRKYRDFKFEPNVIEKNGVTYKNSYDFLNNNTFDKGLNKKEINFLNKEIQDRGILEQQRRHPFNINSELSSRGILAEDYNAKQVVKDFVPNVLKGRDALKSQYTMGQERINAFDHYLGKPVKNNAYRIHSNSFKNGNGLVYTMPENLINRSGATEAVQPFTKEEFNTLSHIEDYYKNPGTETKSALYNQLTKQYGTTPLGLHSPERFNPDMFLKGPQSEYGIPIIKNSKTVIPGVDYITGTGGGAPFIKEGNKVTMKDVWDIQPFSRNKRLPKFMQDFNANKLLGGKDFTLNQTYRAYPKGIRQTFKQGGTYAY